MLVIASVLLSLAPQGVIHGKGNRLVLPKRPPEQHVQDPAVERDPLQERFHKDALKLRRSQYLPESKEMALIQRIGAEYDEVPERALQLVRIADADLAHGLMRLLRAFGRPEHADELRFLLLTRPFGRATDITVETMAALAQDRASELLFECLTGSRSAVRKHAADSLESFVSEDDVQLLITLSEQERTDIQVKALRLLGEIPTSTQARSRLLRALGQRPVLAEPACRSLIAHGAAAVPDLQSILQRPAVGRSFGYAAIALVAIEERRTAERAAGAVASGTADAEAELFTEDMRAHLLDELTMPDAFQRSAVALALAGMAWRSGDTGGVRYKDREVVDALVQVVAPRAFIPHLALLQELATRRLTQFSGRDFGASRTLWRGWWETMNAVSVFVGSRQRVAVDAAGAASAAQLDWHGRTRRIRLRGEAVELVDPVRPRGSGNGDTDAESTDTLDFLLTEQEMIRLIADLEELGFMRSVRTVRAESDGRRLVLNVGGAVCRTDPNIAPMVLDRFAARIHREAQTQRWQVYRDPEAEPDPAAFWRAERRWLEQHPTVDARDERLEGRILRVLPRLRGSRLDLALQHLTELPDLPGRIDEADGDALVAAADAQENWDERAFRIMEIALLAPGDRVWRTILAAAERRVDRPEGRQALSRIFALLGPDRVLASIDKPTSRAIRLAAMDEIGRLRDVRAVAPLVEALGEDDARIRETAVFVLGTLGAPVAREPLLALLDEPSLDPELRRATWVALARIGGDEVFEILRAAVPSPDPADRRAIVQALGAMDHPAAARELANIYALRGDDTLGLMALEYLRLQGDLLASPALQNHLGHQNRDVRRQVLFLLGSFGDPSALPGLITVLAEDPERGRVAALIAGITGQDVTDRNDRVEFVRGWFSRNGHLAQSAWFLAALREQGVRTTLTPDDFGPGAGTAAVPELCRLIVETKQPYLRSLGARMLRVVTDRDYGTVGPLTPEDQRRAIADRYSVLHDAGKAASRR